MTYNDPAVSDWIDNATTAEILGAMEYAIEVLVAAHETPPPLAESGPTLAAYERYADHAPLREAVLAYAGECLKRVPSMTDQTLGINVLRNLRVWTDDRTVGSTEWGGVSDPGANPSRIYPVSDEVWDSLDLDLPLVDEDELGRQVRHLLEQTCPACGHGWVHHVDRDCATCTKCSQAVKG